METCSKGINRHLSLVGSLLVLAFAYSASAAPVKIIFDTDMITDFDDVGALACLHALADAGECEILATVSSTRGNASVGAIEVINHYYGRSDLPVGAPSADVFAWSATLARTSGFPMPRTAAIFASPRRSPRQKSAASLTS